MRIMARTYRNTPQMQGPKKLKSKKNKASWKAFREQHHHTKAMESTKHLDLTYAVSQ